MSHCTSLSGLTSPVSITSEETPSCSLQSICEICKKVIFKYRCPACEILTCSVSCVKQHKLNRGCSGVRPTSEFLLVQEMTDRTLIRDFAFLETTQNLVTRPVKGDKTSSTTAQKRSALKKLCYERGIWLKTMPGVFARAKVNTSHVRRKTEIWWRLEWRFSIATSPPLVLTDIFVDEAVSIQELVARFFDNSWKIAPVKHQLVSLDNTPLDFFLASDAEVPLNPELGLKEILKGQVVLEFPVILVKPRLSELTEMHTAVV